MVDDNNIYRQADAEADDPLLGCLIILTQMYKKPYSREALVGGLPLVNNRLNPELFCRSAERAGLNAKVVKRQLNRIPRLVMPVVLMLRSGHSCILKKINEDKTAEVIFPETAGGASTIPLSDLSEAYSGYCIFVQEVFDYESRADEYKLGRPKQWFWGTLFKYNRIYTRVVIAVLMINVFALATPLFVMNVYDRVVPNNAIETLWMLATGVFVVICFDFLLKVMRGYFIDSAGKKADIRLASALFQQVMSIKMRARPKSSGAFANNLREFEVLRDFFTSATMSSLIDLPFLFLFILIIYFVAGSLALIPLVAVPIVIIMAIALELPMRREVGKSYIGSTQKHAVLIEAIHGLELIKGMGAESLMQRKWEQSVAAAARSSQRSRQFSTMAASFTAFMQQLVTIGVVIYGVYLITEGELTVGGLIACTILAGRSLAPLAQMTNVLIRYQQSKIALEGLNKVMSLPTERSEEANYLRRPTFRGEIEFEKASFKYPGMKMPVLKDINIKIKPGERIGLVGGIGSGKSTLQKLILNFYSVDEGKILIDGNDIEQIDPADLRRNIGYVPQEQLLMYGTVRENIAMRMPWCDDEMVLDAAKRAGVDRFLSRNPAGYQMWVGERGDSLSGGQRQSIMLARGILGTPPMLLLDEPTSAMDNRTEQAVIKTLQDYVADKTMILVTHKISLLALVDRLIVLEGGRIIADGPKDKVLAALAQSKAMKSNKPSEES